MRTSDVTLVDVGAGSFASRVSNVFSDHVAILCTEYSEIGNLNGKVERSHLTDQLEFYQLLDYTGDVDLRAKLAVWEEFCHVHRPHAGLKGLTPKALRAKPLA